LTEAFKPEREELVRGMDAIRVRSKVASGQAIVDEIRQDRENDLGRSVAGIGDDR
jgi:hypothetical protein